MGRSIGLGLAFLLLLVARVEAFATGADARDETNQVAEQYVRLGLSLAAHDPLPIFFFGPEEWRTEAGKQKKPLGELKAQVDRLIAHMQAVQSPEEPSDAERHAALMGRLISMRTRIDMLMGHFPESFEEELRLMYGVTVPRRDEAHFLELTSRLDKLVPGEGELAVRVERFRDQFRIPVDRLEPVMIAAMDECHKRTVGKLELPANEQAKLILVQNKPWVGFTLYKGNSISEILINKDVPVHIDRAIELGCHEAYPGHHVHATLIDAGLVRSRHWMEYTLITLYGPQAIIAEGVASYAEDLVFTPSERLHFEKTKLMPLAGLDASTLEAYNRYREIKHELNYARNEVARRYLYEGMSREEAVAWLRKFGLETEGTAIQRMNFIDAMRAYVVSYNYGKDLVGAYIKRMAGDDVDKRWAAYTSLITRPVIPSDLQ